MKPGDLRRFRDSLFALGADLARRAEGNTFMVLRVDPATERIRGVDILLDGKLEEGLGYFWVMNSSEAVSEAR